MSSHFPQDPASVLFDVNILSDIGSAEDLWKNVRDNSSLPYERDTVAFYQHRVTPIMSYLPNAARFEFLSTSCQRISDVLPASCPYTSTRAAGVYASRGPQIFSLLPSRRFLKLLLPKIYTSFKVLLVRASMVAYRITQRLQSVFILF